MLGEILANQGLRQLRIAETEKYAHVTFFFNGGSEVSFINEDRILLPSPKVATYDLLPEMSAPELTQQLIGAINGDAYDVIICNYANADMVGHTGNFDAAVKAIECLDQCLKKVGQAVTKQGGYLLITADHGNAEIMFDPKTNQPHTAHTNELVPFLFIGDGWHEAKRVGSLIDIAPTILTLLGIEKPFEMTGQSLLVANHVTN
jgi:2,3-bisphosphoglycerate-independent phosphoglycerate mutase